jgi:hypothetical protein
LLISKNRLPFEFNVEVYDASVEGVNILLDEIQQHKLKFCMMSSEAFILFILESYDAKRLGRDL